jgi:hypothetical protein
MFTGKKILELFKRDLDQIFGLSLGEVLAKHERDFWVVVLMKAEARSSPIC